MMFSFRIIMGLAMLIMLLLPNQAQAHRFAPSLFKIAETTQHNYNVVWKTPTEATSNIHLRPTWPVSCEVKSESNAVREGTGTISSWTLGCDQLGDSGLIGQKLGVAGLSENQASAMVMLTLRDGRYYQSVVNAENPDFLVPVAPSQTKVMTEYPLLGIEHIWGGVDHLMFVFGLLLLVGGGSRLLWTITAFTVGHSISLAVVTLGSLDYPVPLLEFAIALSIFVLALELTHKKPDDLNKNMRSLFWRYPWWLAGGFGLLHGMGFAGALAEIGLPQDNVPLALLFFNIGIEIGQIAFVLLAIGFWWLVKRTFISKQVMINHERLLPIPVYVLGGLSAMWCIERGLDLLG
jgi:hydrogenase/urease accessory protein HupE